jgi:hypothetical protein
LKTFGLETKGKEWESKLDGLRNLLKIRNSRSKVRGKKNRNLGKRGKKRNSRVFKEGEISKIEK